METEHLDKIDKGKMIKIVRHWNDLINLLIHQLEALEIHSKKILVISGKGATAKIARTITSLIPRSIRFKTIGVDICADEFIKPLAIRLRHDDFSGLISIGGGSVIDCGKILSSELDIPHIVIATSLSSDAVISPSATLIQHSSGRKISISTQLPKTVLINTDITVRAAHSMVVSGILDIFSNLSALYDAELATSCGFPPISDQSKNLSLQAVHIIKNLDISDINTHGFQKSLAQAILISGYSMQSHGDSTPCSGSEHAISHAMDYLKVSSGSHGIQVGCAMLFCDSLRKIAGLRSFSQDERKLLNHFRHSYLLPRNLGLTRADFLRATHTAIGWRLGRYTCLDHIPSSRFVQAMDNEFSIEDFAPCDHIQDTTLEVTSWAPHVLTRT